MLEAAISGAVLILSILFIRIFFRRQLSPQLQYSLWGLAAFRLCLGVLPLKSLPASRFSIIFVLTSLKAELFQTLSGGGEGTAGAASKTVDNLTEALGSGAANTANQPVYGGGPAGGAAQGAAGNGLGLLNLFQTASGEQLLFAVYLLGVLVCLGWMIGVTWSFSRRAANGSCQIGTAGQILEELERGYSRTKDQLKFIEKDDIKFQPKYRIKGRQKCPENVQVNCQPKDRVKSLIRLAERGGSVPVYLSSEIATPCLLMRRGRPVIYITPEAAETQERLYYAVLHEMVHLAHGDLLWSALRPLLSGLYWFHPLAWVAAIISKQDCEIACDAGVIRAIGEEQRWQYGRTLVEMTASEVKRTGTLCAATAMNSGKREMKERIIMISKAGKKNTFAIAGIIALALLVTASTFTSATAQTAPGGAGGRNVQGSSSMPAAEMSAQERQALQAFGEQWSTAFSDRNGKEIHRLCAAEELYLTLGDIGKNDSGETYYSIGMSSPWPWHAEENVVVLKDSTTFDVYYFYRTSTPTVSLYRQTVSVEKEQKGEYRVVGAETAEIRIASFKEFETVYGEKLPNFQGWTVSYQQRVEEDLILSSHSVGRMLMDPVTALQEQLNIDASALTKTEVRYHPVQGMAEVTIQWPDGAAKVVLNHPETEQKFKAWIVKEIKWS